MNDFSYKNESFTGKKKKKKINIGEYESADSWKKRAMLAREIAKNLLPELHTKTHFQAASCVANNLPRNLNK